MTARIRESEINTTVIEAGVRQKNNAVCWLYFTNLVRKIRSKSAFLWQKTAHVLELIYSRVHCHWTNWHPEANQTTDSQIPQPWFNYHSQSKTFSLQLLHYLTGEKKKKSGICYSVCFTVNNSSVLENSLVSPFLPCHHHSTPLSASPTQTGGMCLPSSLSRSLRGRVMPG